MTHRCNHKGFRVPYDLDGTPHRQTCRGKHVHHKSKRGANVSTGGHNIVIGRRALEDDMTTGHGNIAVAYEDCSTEDLERFVAQGIDTDGRIAVILRERQAR